MEPDAVILCPDQEHHNSRHCPVCQPIIHGSNPIPEAHYVGEQGPELWAPRITKDTGDGVPQ
jgi:hypothetical protein